MVCIVVARNGEGDAWLFGSLPEARAHPIPQLDDVYATGPAELADQYGREAAKSLLRFAEGRDREVLSGAFETWKSGKRTATLAPEARELLWERVKSRALKPLTDPVAIVMTIKRDRLAREGKTLRSVARVTDELTPVASATTRTVNRGESKMDKEENTVNDTAENTGNAATETTAAEGGEKKAKGTAIRPPKYGPDMVITVKAEKNPKRPGSASEGRFNLYTNGMTVKQALDAGVRLADLSYDTNKGFIEIAGA